MTCSFAPFGGGSRVVSLWDMLQFYADKLVEALNTLNRFEVIFMQTALPLQNEDMIKSYDNQVKRLQKILEDIKLNVSARQAHTLSIVITNADNNSPEAKAAVIKQYSEELRSRIADELDGKSFYFISSHVELMSDPFPFGESVNDSFPSAQYDIREAGQCLALKRSTACVFHLMRILEIGLSALVSAIDLRMEKKTWNTILNRFEAEIRSRDNKADRKKWKINDEKFLAEAATYIRMVKNAWRNHAIHGKDVYTDEQAEEIYRSVKSFMRHLSGRLSEEE